MKRFLALVGILAVSLAFYSQMNDGQPSSTTPEPSNVPSVSLNNTGSSPLLPLPPLPTLSRDKVELGRLLFHDPQLSHDNSLSCASCHDLKRGGVDRLAVSKGIYGQLGGINAPTVFNSSLNVAQFWDGRAKTLEEQAAGPIQNPLEMGSNWPEVLGKLNADAKYRQAFQQIYADGITPSNITDALATFERTLITYDSAFDRYLAGDRSSMTALEIEGYQRFVDHGCASCHQGAGVGGNMFQQFGVLGNYFEGRTLTPADMGRFNVTHLEADRHVFKVPTLRNIAVTAPYFHDGSAKTLEVAIHVMGKVQLGRTLSNEDVKAIAAFLRTLTGKWEGKTLQ